MTAIDRTGFWRVTTGQDGSRDADRLGDDDGRRLFTEGAPDVVRIEVHAAGGFAATQHSGAAMTLPSGQVIPDGTSTRIQQG